MQVRFSRTLGAAVIPIAALVMAGFGMEAQAAPTWQVQADFVSSTTDSLRGIALSPDGSAEYLGFIQSGAGRSIREYSSGVLAGTNPTITNSTSTSSFQPKGVATDDRGYVYATDNNSAGANSEKFSIFSSDLLTTESTTTTATVGPPAYSLGGIEVQKVGGNYYAYVATNKGAATIERWNVNNPAAPVLDSGWAGSGVLNLKTTQGSNAFVNGLCVAPDGTIYATGGVLSTDRGDKVFKISADGTSISSANVTQAMDVALYGGDLYVAEYNSSASAIGVLSASDLSSITTLTTGFAHAGAPGNDDGYSGITVNSSGQLYVSDQIYGSTGGTQDRVLVSSPVPEPMSLGLVGVGALALRRRRRV